MVDEMAGTGRCISGHTLDVAGTLSIRLSLRPLSLCVIAEKQFVVLSLKARSSLPL